MKSLCLAYITSRKEPQLDWFQESLIHRSQSPKADFHQAIYVDAFKLERDSRLTLPFVAQSGFHWVLPKPTVWQGKHRLTKEDWWAVSNARNTALCLCETDYIVWVDDRCVLLPGWLDAAQAAAEGGYSVCGTYEKRIGLQVEGGIITHSGTVTGMDGRLNLRGLALDRPHKAARGAYYGGTLGMPVETALTINGFEESMDGLGMEDCMAGLHLANHGFPVMFDPRLKIIEDRTPELSGPVMKRSSKERHPHDQQDKAHEALRRFGKLKRTSHQWDLREIRDQVLAGNPFPIPTGPTVDWFDQQPLSEMV